MIRRMKKYVPATVLENVYKAIVLPYFDYCSLVWESCSVYLQDKLQKMQNRAARVITGKPYDTRISDMLNELGWQPLAERRRSQKIIFMHKAKNKQFPESISSMFHINRNDNYNLRNNNVNYALPKPKTDFMKKSISYSAVSLWNSLPKAAKVNDVSIWQLKQFSRADYNE